MDKKIEVKADELMSHLPTRATKNLIYKVVGFHGCINTGIEPLLCKIWDLVKRSSDVSYAVGPSLHFADAVRAYLFGKMKGKTYHPYGDKKIPMMRKVRLFKTYKSAKNHMRRLVIEVLEFNKASVEADRKEQEMFNQSCGRS